MRSRGTSSQAKQKLRPTPSVPHAFGALRARLLYHLPRLPRHVSPFSRRLHDSSFSPRAGGPGGRVVDRGAARRAAGAPGLRPLSRAAGRQRRAAGPEQGQPRDRRRFTRLRPAAGGADLLASRLARMPARRRESSPRSWSWPTWRASYPIATEAALFACATGRCRRRARPRPDLVHPPRTATRMPRRVTSRSRSPPTNATRRMERRHGRPGATRTARTTWMATASSPRCG